MNEEENLLNLQNNNQVNIDLKNLISECTNYDFKVMLEEKKPKSWLKSVSAFANGLGGSLLFGVENDTTIKGLENVQYVCEFISSKIRDYMDPIPDIELIPLKIDNLEILQVKVNSGHYTPYYYVGDGQRLAFIRTGEESNPATAEQMVRLVLQGSNQTFDSLNTSYKKDNHSFSILANTFKQRTNKDWNSKYLLSFGLINKDESLTNAGALYSDDCPLMQSRLYCTRWEGTEKGDAINDAEFNGNILMLLREGMNFVKSNTKRGWEKLPDGRKNKPEYSMRAVLETMVNHLIHRDYTVLGGEVHLDIYDDRLVVISPGGMYNGKLIQDLNLDDVSSERRNPILANVMAQLNYMEKRGSGLTRICKETKAINQENENEKVIFKSTSTQFQTIIFSSAKTQNVGNNVGNNVENRTTIKLTERQQVIISLISQNSKITVKQMSVTMSVTQRTIERDLFTLKNMGIIEHKGKVNDGYWVVLIKKTPNS